MCGGAGLRASTGGVLKSAVGSCERMSGQCYTRNWHRVTDIGQGHSAVDGTPVPWEAVGGLRAE